jgi:hypothetical protein
MNVQLHLRMEKPDFLAWVQAHEGRYELAGNRVIMTTGAGAVTPFCCAGSLPPWSRGSTAIDGTVLTSDFGVDVGPHGSPSASRALGFFGSGSPGRIRTSDQPVNSRLLYH